MLFDLFLKLHGFQISNFSILFGFFNLMDYLEIGNSTGGIFVVYGFLDLIEQLELGQCLHQIALLFIYIRHKFMTMGSLSAKTHLLGNVKGLR